MTGRALSLSDEKSMVPVRRLFVAMCHCVLMCSLLLPDATAADFYTVSASAGTGGGISPSGNQSVTAGSALTFTLTPDSGYQIGTVGGTCSAGSVDGSAYTTGAITGDCSVTANFEIIPSLLPDAPILSVSDFSATDITLDIASLGEGGSAIESATATCTLDDFEERQNGAAYTVDRASGAFTASALKAPETLAVTDPQITQALARSYAESSKAVQLTLFDSELGEIRLNMSSYSPFSPTATIFIDETDQGFKALNHRRYFRGAVEGFSGSYAFLSLLPSGDFDISYEVGSSSRQGGMRSGVFSLADPVAAARKIPSTLNLDDAIKPEELIIPADAERNAESDAAPVLSTRSMEPRNFILTGSGYSDVYAIEVPAGQSHVGVMSRGPGNAGVVMAKDATTVSAIAEAAQGICRFGSLVNRSCVLEDPEPGTYYFYVYNFDSDPTEISVGFADEVKSYEGFKAPIVIDMDADLYSSFASNDEAVAYLASLFAFSSELYEREVNTQLQIGFVQFRTQDISSSLGSIGSYWNTNYPELERALVAHLTLGYSGGVGWVSDEALCGREYGYSISGVDGIAPTLGAPISWDATVFSHELGHNFNSPHTHEAGGLLGNASVVDRCTSGYLPGVNSLTGGSPGDYNGTVMSYCHLRSGGMSNIASSFGKNHPYGVAADRIPQNMLSTVTNQAAIAPSCIATYIKQREWSRVVPADGISGDGTFDVALEDVAPQQTYTCRAVVSNASGDSLPSNSVIVQTSVAYTVTASAGPGGSISPSGNQSVTAGSALTFTLTPNSGYQIGTVGGSCSAGVLDGSTYTTGAITDNCLVTASFELIPHTVTASAGPGGSISPSGDQAVVPGGTLSFTLTPDSGYQIGTVGGTCSAGVLDGSTYTTGAITDNCLVTASFELIPHTVTASAGPGGSISPSGDQAVVPGGTLSFTLTPDSGYQIGTVGGTCSAGSVDGSAYTTGAITGDCSVTANFEIIPSLLPDAPILSVSDFSATDITLDIASLGEGGSAIESATATCTLDDFEERQNGAAYTVDRASGAFTASALKAPETLAVTDPQITQALARSYAESSKAVQLTLFDSELGEIRLNMSSYSPFSPTATIFIDETDQGFKALNHRRYFRGAVEGFSGSYAFLSLLPSGDFDISYEVGSSSRQGGMRSGVFSLADPVAAARKIPSTLNLDDAIKPEELIIPADAERNAESDAAPVLSTRSMEPRNFILTGSGYSDVYAIEVPGGQSHVGVMSRGPGNAGVVMAKDATTVSAINEAAQGICRFGSTVNRSCVLEDPEPGTYYFYVYNFDSDPTEISVGFADEVKSYEGFKAPIVIDMDADLYSSFASNDEAVAYLASLFAFSSELYEREVNTQLQIGFVQFRTQDISSSLGSIGSYWNTNYPELERALVAHLTLGYSGGVAYVANEALCGREYGYSISGVDGIAPTLGAPISWDATVFSHELGHNFNSPHTHEAGGLLGNASDVDQCTSGSLPGVNSLTGGSPGGYNGTVMSYCHLRSGGMSNIASSFGENHPYGVAADRIPQNMLSTVTNQAAIAPSCIATYIKQREWSRVVPADGISGDGTFDVALEDVAPQQTYTCRAVVSNASGDSLPSNSVIVQTSVAYTVTASAGPGGSISPSGNQSVTAGSALTFTLTPNSGYQIGTVGGSCSAGVLDGSTYTTGAITDNCLVTASFELIPHTVTASAGPGGSISPSGDQAVVPGGTLSFTLTPDSGYQIGTVGGSCSAGVVDGDTYTTGAITGDCSVMANFNAIPELTSGTTMSSLSGAQGSDEYFYIDVPANATSLTVQLVVGSGDPDIYVGTSYPPPTTSSADCYSELPAGNNESCTINSPSEGRYYVRVYGYTAYSAAVLTVSVVAPPGTPSISSITPGNESLSVAFTPGLGSAPTSYEVSCADQGASRLASKSINAETDIGAHFDSSAAVTFGERNYQNLAAYHQSAEFQRGGARCATDASMASQRGSSTTLNTMSNRAADCSFTNTTIDSDYAPVDGQTLIIPVYFHVIYKADGTGYVSEARVQAQIAVLNEDFAGFSGNGYLTSIQFELVDINYVQNDGWYTDAGPNMTSEFKSSLAVDPARYMNIYTNDAGGTGTLGYASLAASGSTGSSSDGIVMLHDTIGGRNNGFDVYDEGRTLVHEVGHYLGLEHTFMPQGSCDLPNDYTHGDLIADTPAQLSPDFGTSSSSSCGAPSAIENFMNYSDDDAMYTFTEEQANRMICSLMSYRSNAYSVSGIGGTVTATGSSSPITVAGLTNNNSYSCTVTANNADGSSGASAAVAGTPKAPTVPGRPAVSRTDYGDGEIYLYVTVSDNGGSAIISYAATCTDGSTSYVGTSTTSPITVSGLTNDVSYTCTATATNSVGASTTSATTAPIIPEETATGLPIWLLYEATQSR